MRKVGSIEVREFVPYHYFNEVDLIVMGTQIKSISSKPLDELLSLLFKIKDIEFCNVTINNIDSTRDDLVDILIKRDDITQLSFDCIYKKSMNVQLSLDSSNCGSYFCVAGDMKNQDILWKIGNEYVGIVNLQREVIK